MPRAQRPRSGRPRSRGDLGTGLVLERELFSDLFSTDDQREGMGAFVEKRKAVFTGW